MNARTALLIRCSTEEATRIHNYAESERRSVAGHVLNIVLRATAMEERMAAQIPRLHELNRVTARTPFRPAGQRTAILVRCTAEEANRIRRVASRRQMTISGFVLHCMHRSWNIRLGKTISTKSASVSPSSESPGS